MNVPEIEINEQSSPESIENWDSFNGYVLLDELESEFNVKFTMDDVLDVKTVSDIKRHLQNYGVNFSD
jgi:acyl carrier protein